MILECARLDVKPGEAAAFEAAFARAQWKKLPHHFYDPFPTVEHYEPL